MIHVTYMNRRPHAGQFSIEELFRTIREHLPKDIVATTYDPPDTSRGLLPRIRIALGARRNRGEVNHITGDIHFVAMMLPGDRTVLTIHDCVSLENSSGLRHWLLKAFWFRAPTRRVARITVISEKTREELLRHVSIPKEKILVIPNCVAKDFHRGDPAVLDRTNVRILQIGVKPNKNLNRVAAALEGLNCTLEIIGEPDAGQAETLQRHRIRYNAATGLSRQDLAERYRKANVVVFASTYEGFGMPAIEAQACGTALLTSNLSPMKEVAGDGACLVDPLDPSDIRAGLDRLIGDDAYREQVVQAGLENVRRYRPDAVAEQYARLYRELAR